MKINIKYEPPEIEITRFEPDKKIMTQVDFEGTSGDGDIVQAGESTPDVTVPDIETPSLPPGMQSK